MDPGRQSFEDAHQRGRTFFHVWNCGRRLDGSGRVVSPEILRRSTYLLRHRGPDDEGYFHGPEGQNGVPPEVQVALGHRRLAIIDLVGGKQPLANEDQTVSGRLQWGDLQLPLSAAGVGGQRAPVPHPQRYRSSCPPVRRIRSGDARPTQWDVCLCPVGRSAAGAAFGSGPLRGKALFYWLDRGGLAFASELKALLALPGVPREVDPAAIDLFLTYQYVPHPRTIYRQIRKLPPGHFLWWQKDRLETGPYWNPDFQQEEQDFQPKKAAEELRELLTDAVRLRLESDVPLGAFLSGGIDSTIIVGLMQRLCSQPVHTFSIGFPVAEYDESHYARQAAEFLGTRHHEFRVYPDAVGILPKLIWHYDEPFADSSAIPTWYLAQYTRQEVTVALTGDGGDELFAGYPRYQAVRLAQKVDLLPGPLRRLLTGPLLEVMPQSARFKSPWRRLRRFLEQMGLPPLERYLQWIGIFPDGAPQQALYHPVRRAAGYQRCPAAGMVSSRGFCPCRPARPSHSDHAGGSGHLPAVRSDDEGRHSLDGPQFGMPAAFPGSSGRGICRAIAAEGEVGLVAGQAVAAANVPRAAAAGNPASREDGLRGAFGHMVSGAPFAPAGAGAAGATADRARPFPPGVDPAIDPRAHPAPTGSQLPTMGLADTGTLDAAMARRTSATIAFGGIVVRPIHC